MKVATFLILIVRISFSVLKETPDLIEKRQWFLSIRKLNSSAQLICLDFGYFLCYKQSEKIGASQKRLVSLKGDKPMIWWILILLVLFILSYLSQVGILFLLEIKFPFLTSSLINILILVCMAIVLFRILSRMKKGEKENLKKKIKELEAELKALKQGESTPSLKIRREEEQIKEPEAKEEDT